MAPPQKTTTTTTTTRERTETFMGQVRQTTLLEYRFQLRVERANHVIKSTSLNRVARLNQIHRNFTGKNGLFPSQGGAHFNLEELKNTAFGSMKGVLNTPIKFGDNNTHVGEIFSMICYLI